MAGKTICFAVAVHQLLHRAALLFSVFVIQNLRITGDEGRCRIGVIDSPANRAVGDLLAYVSPGLEASRQIASPELALVKVDAPAILQDIAAQGGDIPNLGRCRLAGGLRQCRTVLLYEFTGRDICEGFRRSDMKTVFLLRYSQKLRKLSHQDQVLIIPHPVFQKRHEVGGAAKPGGSGRTERFFEVFCCSHLHTHCSSLRRLGRIINWSLSGMLCTAFPLAWATAFTMAGPLGMVQSSPTLFAPWGPVGS